MVIWSIGLYISPVESLIDVKNTTNFKFNLVRKTENIFV